MFKFTFGTGCLSLLLSIYTLYTWVVNLLAFIECDFVEPFREEVIYGLGVIFPPITWVTVWIDISAPVVI